MTTEELSIDGLAELAHANRQGIIESKNETGKWFLVLARLLKQNRDMSLYKMLDHDTFESFLGDPDISFRRTTAYNLIRKYELFVDKLGRDEEVLAQIGTTKLGIIAPVVESDPEGWMDKALALSQSDLVTEVRAAQGKTEAQVGDKPEPPTLPAPLLADEWVKKVKTMGCAVCGVYGSGEGQSIGGGRVDFAHFPRTVGAGAEEWKGIPLCRRCHREQHDGGKDWLWENRVRLFDFFYCLLVTTNQISGKEWAEIGIKNGWVNLSSR